MVKPQLAPVTHRRPCTGPIVLLDMYLLLNQYPVVGYPSCVPCIVPLDRYRLLYQYPVVEDPTCVSCSRRSNTRVHASYYRKESVRGSAR